MTALLNDHFRRGWWRLLNAQLAVFGIAAIVYTSLRQAGPLDPGAGRTLHFVLLWIIFAAAAGAALTSVGPPSKLDLLPVSNRLIAAAIMSLPALWVATIYAVTASMLNGVFGVEWPVWGPALFLGMAVGVFQAISLAAGPNRATRLAGWSAAGILLEDWLHSCYGGGAFLLPKAMWRQVTTADLASFALSAIASFLVMRAEIARDRRGDGALILIKDWRRGDLVRTRSTFISPFPNSGRAQFWFEWRQKGLIIPGIFAAFSCFLLGGYMLGQFQNGEYELLHGYFGFGTGLAPIAAIVGLVAGHLDLAGANPECGSFLATRPMTNAALAGALLKAIGMSLLVAWFLWCVAMLATTGWLHLHQGAAPVVDLWTLHGKFDGALASLGYWYAATLFVVVLVAAWIALSLSASLVLTGRQRLLAAGTSCAIPLLLTGLFLAGRAAEGSADLPQSVWQIVIGSISMAATTWVFVAALRRGQIGLARGVRLLAGWLLACAAGACIYILVGPLYVSDLVLMAGLMALALAPLAAAPLALAWNRHR
jgi:hypothetical protein